MSKASAAWTIHGASEVILTRKALDKWTGKTVTLTLENGDGFEHIPTGSWIEEVRMPCDCHAIAGSASCGFVATAGLEEVRMY